MAASAQWLKIAAWGAIVAAVVHLGWIVSDGSACFQDSEVHTNWAGRILLDGKAPSLSDFKTALDAWRLDGDSRPRFLSYLAAIWTAKARLALWNLVPPHPSFSPVWLLSLGLAPWLLYRFLRIELGCRWSALLGAGLYMFTAGYLSSASMLFHPGKPLANFVAICTLFMASKANQRLRSADSPISVPRLPASMAAYLVLALPLGLLVDETALFALAIPPIWNHRYFFSMPRGSRDLRIWLANALCLAVPVAIYLLLAFVAVPRLSGSLAGNAFDFGSYLSRFHDAGKFDAGHLVRHLATLSGAVLVPWPALGAKIPIAVAPIHGGLVLAGCLAVFSWLGWRASASRPSRTVCARIGILLMVYLPFQTYVAAHHPQDLVVSGFYYGAIYSVLIAIFLATALSVSLQDVRVRGWAGALLGGALAVQAFNFRCLNESWQAHSRAKSMGWYATFTYNPFWAYCDLSSIRRLFATQRGNYVADIPEASDRGRARWLAELWRGRGGGYRELLGRRPLALADLWWLAELYLDRTPASIGGGGGNRADEPMHIRAYRAAAERARLGRPEEEALPVLAFRKPMPDDSATMRLLDTRLLYPFPFADVRAGVQQMRNVAYSHWLIPADGKEIDGDAFWAFHNGLQQALADKKLYEYGIIAVGQTNVAGRELVVLDMRR